MAKEVAARTEQLSLWYDTPLAKSIPNRSLNKGEMYIIKIAPPDTPSFSYGEEGGASLLS